MKRTTPTARLFTRCLGPASLAMLAFAACSSDDSSSTTTIQLPPRIAVTSVKGDTESELLAAIYARVLEDGGFRVARKDPVEMDRAGYYQAIQDNEFQLIPDYSGELVAFVYSQEGAAPLPSTSLPAPATTQAPIIVTTTTIEPTTTLPATTDTAPTDTAATNTAATDTAATGAGTTTTVAATTTSAGASGFVRSAATTTSAAATSDTTADTTVAGDTTASGDTTTTVAPTPGNGHSVTEQVLAINAGLPDKLVVNNGALAENRQVIACTAAAMEANSGTQLTTLTNLASVAPGIVIGGSAEYLADDTSGFPLMERYYGGEFKDTVAVEDDGLADAITNGDADCFAMNSLNPLITTQQMTILTDDRYMIPSNAALALMDSTVATPEAIAAIDAIATSLTTERLNQMLNQIAGGTSVVTVANAFVDTL